MSGPTEGNLNSTTPAAPSGKQNVLFQTDSPYIDSTTGLLERDISAYPQPATSSLEGTVMLAGDIGGSADTPRVVGVQGVGVSATAPTNGQVLQYNSTSGLYVPTTPSSSSLAYAPFNSMLAPATVTPPVISALTWGNQGTASAAYNAGGAVYFSDGPGSGSNNLRHLYKSAPSTPWTLTIAVVPGIGLYSGASSWNQCGILLRQSSTSKLMFLFVGPGSSGTPQAQWAKYTSYSAFSADYWSYSVSNFGYAVWMQVTNNGTNFIWQFAIDGQNFKTIDTRAVTDFFSGNPDQVGIGINPLSANYVTDAAFLHWAGI